MLALGYHIFPFNATVLKLFYTIFHIFWAKIRKNRHVFCFYEKNTCVFLFLNSATRLCTVFGFILKQQSKCSWSIPLYSSQKLIFCQNSQFFVCLISYAFYSLPSIFVTRPLVFIFIY